MKKNIFLASIESVLFVVVLFLAFVNYKANTTAQLSISTDGTIVILSTFFLIIGVYFIGVFSGFIYSVVLGSRYKDQIEFYARKNEKLSQQNEIDTDDKEALQRKIATLEIALNNALKNKD